ncbi:LrgB family protein [Bacillus massilinigeriensis]|uniref:LrgB family protein n=1 Tax=Bacillus massilionigeriensis TaxID=1805475 RepID=UPI00096B351F|nr:LrgB family protein [Bacillus massilionigeriensis]
MQQEFYAFIIILITVMIYLSMRILYMKYPSPFFMPLLPTTVIIIILIIISHHSYHDFMVGGKYIQSFLGPAVVALAYPLYKQRQVLISHIAPILGGVIIGLVAALLSGFLFSIVFGLERAHILSLVPKSLTTPIAIQVSSGIGGIPSLTVAFVMIAGFTGTILGPLVIKWANIQSDLGKGIGFGSASHAFGTSKAFEYGELTASMSSVSMTLSAIIGSVVGPLFVWLFHL